MMTGTGIGWQGVLIRFLLAVVLVFTTYNPEEYSYFHWVRADVPTLSVLQIFLGVVLLIGWVMFLRATLRSLGLFGLLLASAFFGTLLWLVVDLGWVAADNVRAVTYIVLFALCGVLATGVSWSLIRRRFSGQVDVDDVEIDG